MEGEPAKTPGRPPFVEFILGFDRIDDESLGREFIWLLWHGRWCWGRNRRPLIVGVGRLWYDGPHWYAHLGWLGVSLSY